MPRPLHVDQITRAARPPARWLVNLTRLLGRAVFGPPRPVHVRAEGLEHLPLTPCILATNHTHNYDFLPLRHFLYGARGQHAATWIKARAWQSPLQAFYLRRTANVPLSSRGYVLAADYRALVGRRPSDATYRALRAHLDAGVALPPGEDLERLVCTPRDILGVAFDPAREPYGAAIERVFSMMMDASIEVARAHAARGAHLHLYPQGTRSGRLTAGLPGVIHAAQALALPVIPVAVLGVRRAMPDQGLRTAGGTITLRFGSPLTPALEGLSAGYRPFRPLSVPDEAVVGRALDELMRALNALCDAEHCMLDGYESDAKQGVARFL